MARRTRSIREMREMYEAAEARGLVDAEEKTSKPREGTSRQRPKAKAKAKSQPRLKVVWNVCDIGGRTVATFDYPQKAEAEAHADELKAQSKGDLFFVRSEKVPMD